MSQAVRFRILGPLGISLDTDTAITSVTAALRLRYQWEDPRMADTPCRHLLEHYDIGEIVARRQRSNTSGYLSSSSSSSSRTWDQNYWLPDVEMAASLTGEVIGRVSPVTIRFNASMPWLHHPTVPLASVSGQTDCTDCVLAVLDVEITKDRKSVV